MALTVGREDAEDATEGVSEPYACVRGVPIGAFPTSGFPWDDVRAC